MAKYFLVSKTYVPSDIDKLIKATLYAYQHPYLHLISIMLSSLPLMALILVQSSMVTIEAPVPTLGGSTTSVTSAADLEVELGDLVIPQAERPNTTLTQIHKNRSVTDYTSLLNEIGDLRLPSNITAGLVARAAK